MRAVRVIRHGEPGDVIEVQDIPAPDPGPGQVRVAVSAAPLNFGDLARCRGGIASVTTEPPFTLGMEACGEVDAAGPGGEQWVGRRVVAMSVMSLGGMADYALAQLTGVFDAPGELDDIDAAGLLLPYHTTYLALHTRAADPARRDALDHRGGRVVGYRRHPARRGGRCSGHRHRWWSRER